MRNFKELKIWQKGFQIAINSFRITESFPSQEKYGLASQINKAGVSIPSNIAEGMGRNYKKDTIQFVHIARGSMYELETLLNIAVMVDIISEEEFAVFPPLIDELLKMMNGLIKSLEQRSDLK